MKSLHGVLLASLFLLVPLAGCVFEPAKSTDGTEIEAIFSYSPNNNIMEGTEVSFDASDSLPQDQSLTYKWDFDGDGSTDSTGKTSTHSYANAGTYDATLTISTGSKEASQTREIKVAAADAVAPSAHAGSGGMDTDCEGDDVSSESYYIYHICENDKQITDRRIDSTTTVNLDASSTKAGGSDDFIASWEWDINLGEDSDGDGHPENDADLTGESPTWKNVAPGKYEINLTVTNGEGLSDNDKVYVYVNYVGTWTDFQINGNTSNKAVDLDFEFSVSYNIDSGNKLRRVQAELTYPEHDDDWVVGSEQSRNMLDLLAYDSEGEYITGTNQTAPDPDTRNHGDCDDENDDCVWLTVQGFFASDSQHGDGAWEMLLRNEKVNDVQVTELVLRILYK